MNYECYQVGDLNSNRLLIDLIGLIKLNNHVISDKILTKIILEIIPKESCLFSLRGYMLLYREELYNKILNKLLLEQSIYVLLLVRNRLLLMNLPFIPTELWQIILKYLQ